MKPIAIALDRVQTDTCMIGDSVIIWKELKSELATHPSSIVDKVDIRMKQALTPAHYLANILNPFHCGKGRLSV